MLKIVLFIAFIGHALCGICDCLLSYSPSGRIDLKKAVKDGENMRTAFHDLPIKWPLISVIMGVYAITAFAFGYLGLSEWMEQFSKTASIIMYISAVVFLISIVVHNLRYLLWFVSGKTLLPKWICALNTLPLILVLMPTKLPAKGNIAGAIMYLGLFAFIA